ncbi:hypothetical protein D6810_00490 [Candidatus Dojkabacteria bacterium]|uniref:Uncharacterized protein n=1 Tax=Candidatus Dojkabacteria bacterium TaxID=2099670 RepID=A0A3M0Z2C2_9BACT|nr:MAG: hypothetical protein D6810_00490 [Candidatus Dojkabacteria bacterium]
MERDPNTGNIKRIEMKKLLTLWGRYMGQLNGSQSDGGTPEVNEVVFLGENKPDEPSEPNVILSKRNVILRALNHSGIAGILSRRGSFKDFLSTELKVEESSVITPIINGLLHPYGEADSIGSHRTYFIIPFFEYRGSVEEQNVKFLEIKTLLKGLVPSIPNGFGLFCSAELYELIAALSGVDRPLLYDDYTHFDYMSGLLPPPKKGRNAKEYNEDYNIRDIRATCVAFSRALHPRISVNLVNTAGPNENKKTFHDLECNSGTICLFKSSTRSSSRSGSSLINLLRDEFGPYWFFIIGRNTGKQEGGDAILDALFK